MMDSEQLADNIHPIVKRVLAARISDPKDLCLDLKDFPDPLSVRDMAVGVQRIISAMARNQRIVIAGDYDADGATSTSILVLGLAAMGATNVYWQVPDRFRLGYGLTPALVDAIKLQRSPDLIITVDNGISAHDGIDAARKMGIDVIVTDHHLIGERGVPDACAVIDPARPDDTSGLGSLAGVGVAFLLLVALRSQLAKDGWFAHRARPNLADLLDLVALGTVADVVSLGKINRTMVDAGIKRIRAGHCRPGITALISVGGRVAKDICASDLGFCLAPRINASGRLEDISLGIRCLLSDDHVQAAQYAAQLDTLNRERKEIEKSMKALAMQFAQRAIDDMGGDIPCAMALYDTSWHEGVVGLVAGKIREQHHRPVAAFAPGVNGALKGSVRSIPGIHARDVLARIESLYPGLILGFGGHAAAAGLSLAEMDFERFREAFCDVSMDMADNGAFVHTVWTDGEIDPHDIALTTAQAIAQAGPWGRDFPAPLFEGEFRIKGIRMLSGGAHASIEIETKEGAPIEAKVLAFNLEHLEWEPSPGPVKLVYELLSDEWQGVARPMMRVEAAEQQYGTNNKEGAS